MQHPKNFIYYDTNLIYRCPMIRSDTRFKKEIEDIIDIKLVADKYGYTFVPLVEGYEPKYFFDLYVEQLFRENYITIK